MIRSLWILLILGVFLGGCATVPKKPSGPQGGAVPLQDLCRKYTLDCRWDGVSQTVTMEYHSANVQVMVGSAVVVIGKDSVMLSGPLMRHRGIIFVPADFERTVLGPMPSPSVPGPSRLTGFIVIDPGHGGKDPGAVGFGGVEEKELNLDIARRVVAGLERSGFKATMTRKTDDFITLQNRTAIASTPGVDLFVSIHANASKSRNAKGIEVYYAGMLNSEDRAEPQRKQNLKKLCESLNMRKDNIDLRDIVGDMLYAHKMGFAPGLADALARGLSDDLNVHVRGSKPERYFVLRNTLIPAVLIEVGFITSPRESRKLKEDGHRQKMADAVTKSILEYWYASGI